MDIPPSTVAPGTLEWFGVMPQQAISPYWTLLESPYGQPAAVTETLTVTSGLTHDGASLE